MRELKAPAGRHVGDWLLQFDNTPASIPAWPRSPELVLATYTDGVNGEPAKAVLFESEEEFHRSVNLYGQTFLFFTVPRTL
jgi:hypothetical protein